MGSLVLAGCLVVVTAAAGPAPVSIPIDREGQVDVGEVVERLADRAGLEVEPPRGAPRLSVTGLAGGLTRTLLAEALGPDVSLKVRDGELMVTLTPEALQPSRLPELETRLRNLAEHARVEAGRRLQYGLHALNSYRPNDPTRPTVCLIHGLNSSSEVFIHLIGALQRWGFGVVVYDYPDNRDLDESAPIFARDWAAFRSRVGETRPWAIVAHSMGGLLARWYVEGDRYAGDVSDLILVGTPNQGSGIAQAQTILQLVQGFSAVQGKRSDALAHLTDGLGQASDDMVPGGPFLKALNGQSRRPEVRYHILAGDAGLLTTEARERVEAQFRVLSHGRGLFGSLTRLAVSDLAARLDELTDGRGDGCVAVAATRLDGVPAPVVLHANHLELIRAPLLYPDPGPIVSLPYILEWLHDLRPEGS